MALPGTEKHLKEQPSLWKEMVVRMQQPAFLAAFDVLADYQLDNALYFFRERIEAAFSSREYVGREEANRRRISKNDSIYGRLGATFSYEQALQNTMAVKGANISRNSVSQMLKNWRKQGLIVDIEWMKYRKVQ